MSYLGSSPEDTIDVLNLLRCAQGMTSLSVFPESTAPTAEVSRSLTLALVPFIDRLMSLSVSEWFLSAASMQTISTAPLNRLEIKGRLPVQSDRLEWLVHLTPEGEEEGFTSLRTLIVTNVRLLRIDIAPVVDLEQNDDEVLYVQHTSWARRPDEADASMHGAHTSEAVSQQYLAVCKGYSTVALLLLAK
ncbi:hypothetical protein FRC06_002208 [Ceratobasidium sp. 370]|nr:hypothetical protein FRC06_002208 [Ceratobasidium sp. 370]